MLRAARTLLFVPGDRPDRFDKAVAAGAGAVVLDLEDAVAPAAKEAARAHVEDWLRAASTRVALVVRVNAAGTPWHDDDLAAIERSSRLGASGASGASGGLGGAVAVMLAKAGPADVAATARRLPGTPLLPLLETASGVMAAQPVHAVAGVVRVAFGSVDLAAELGVDPDDVEALAAARGQLVLAAAAAGAAPPIDGVTTNLADSVQVTEDAKRARRLGFGGKLCIHPNQIPLVRAAFEPTPAELRWARDVVAAAGSGSVAVVGGRMVDEPVVRRARGLLDQAAGPDRT